MEAWQIQLVTKNLDALISNTICDTALLAKLRAAEVISKADSENVSQTGLTPLEKCDKLYDILLKKHGAYDALLQALHETKQSGACQILNQKSLNYKFYGAISYDKTAIIGKGCYNTFVYQGFFGGRNVAVKKVHVGDVDRDTEFSLKEIDFMMELDGHENVVRYYLAEEKDDFIYIAMELCCTNIQDWVRNKCVVIDQKEICQQAIKGLEHIHGQKIIHRDLKPANILINSHPLVKIADFGLSKRIPHESTHITAHSSGVGTEGWMAPEVLEKSLPGPGKKLSTATDIFSAGCIFYFVFTDGVHPYGDHCRRPGNILDNKPQFDPSTVKLVPAKFLALIKEMIVPDPSLRPTASSVIQKMHASEDDNEFGSAEIPTEQCETEKQDFEFITQNIFKLVRDTNVNSMVLNELLQEGLISDVERDELMDLPTQFRSLKLYQLLQDRKNGYESLQNTLKKADQLGAFQILTSMKHYKSKQTSESTSSSQAKDRIIKNIYKGEMETKIRQYKTFSSESMNQIHRDICEQTELLCLKTKLVERDEWTTVESNLNDMFSKTDWHNFEENPILPSDATPIIAIDLGTKNCNWTAISLYHLI